MKRMDWLRSVLFVLASTGLLTPQSVVAGGAANRVASATASSADVVRPTAAIGDVALRRGGQLRGQVVDTAGAPVVAARVAVLRQGREPAVATTDAEGYFGLDGLAGGVYQVSVGQTVATYRAWAADTAPPAAQQDVLLVSDGQVVRGQAAVQGPLQNWLTNPWVIGGVIGTAIAVPVALSNDKPSNS
jgi:hypothetical protein